MGRPAHWWSKGFNNRYVLYSPDPTGWVVGYYGSSTKAPSNAATYGADCASVDGCSGQGSCGAGPAPSPTPSYSYSYDW